MLKKVDVRILMQSIDGVGLRKSYLVKIIIIETIFP